MPTPATFYKFRKESNSTAIPDNVEGIVKIEYQIELKSPTNICAPVIILNTGAAANSPIEYNYVHIPAFNRYYWVADWVYNNGLWVASLSVDVLASFRGQIGATTQYITRSSADFDPAIIDSLYPIKSGVILSNVDIQWGWTSYAEGCFIVGIVNDDAGGLGGTVAYYVMDRAALANFSAYLMQNPEQWLNISEISVNLSKALVDPTQYVVSVKWVPISPSIIAKTAVTTLKFGFYAVSVTGGVWRVDATALSKTISNITIPKHPQQSRGTYLNNAPYSAYILHFPPFGDIPLDATAMQNATKLHMRMDMDFATTSAVLTVYTDAGPIQSSEVTKARTTIGVDIRMDKIAVETSGINFGFYMLANYANQFINKSSRTESNEFGVNIATSSGTNSERKVVDWSGKTEDEKMQAAIDVWNGKVRWDYYQPVIKQSTTEFWGDPAQLITGGSIKKGISTALSCITDALGASLFNVHSAGTVGSFAEYLHPSVYMQCAFSEIVDENAITGARNIQFRGRPLCKMRQLAAIPGYMEITNPYLEIMGATTTEIDAIKTIMCSGMWYA